MRRFFASRRAVAATALLCLAVMLVSVNVIAAHFASARLDLTADRLFTLSPATRHTLARIDEPITLRFYYSHRLGEALPSYGVYAARVRAMLDQYVAAAHGKLRLEIYDPPPFSNLEDRAVAFGLQAVPLDSQGDQVYFGLAGTNSTDDHQVIPFFSRQRERFLEYDLTRLIHSLAVPKKTVVGLLTSLPLAGDVTAMMQGRPSAPTAIFEELRQLYTVEPLDTTLAAIPPDVDVLMLVQPPKLPPQTLYAIDQFVLKGGKALVFADPYAEAQSAPHGVSTPPGTAAIDSLAPLFKAWGIKLPTDVVAGDRRDAQLVSVPSLDRGLRPLRYVAWLGLDAANLNRHDMITADLSHLTMASAGIVEPLPGRTTRVEPLITTSPDAEKIPVARLAGLPDVEGLLARFKPADERYILAAHITGPARTAFPGGPPEAGPAAANRPAPAAKPVRQSLHPINLVVVADSDMLDDRFWARSQNFFSHRVVVPIADNGDFVADAVEVLAGGEDLIGLRSRGTSARPFVVVDRIRREAEARYSAEEHALEQNLKATEERIAALTGGRGSDTPASLSPQQARAIAQFRTTLLETRRQLREVQAALRGRIESLRTAIEFCDIALVPILVTLAAVIVAVLRSRRRRRRTPREA
ncbi:MAG TPA: Gldg family protein [Stellaceae bacterium]|nr:Gldg family protein [Stellaceae bacterium]